MDKYIIDIIYMPVPLGKLQSKLDCLKRVYVRESESYKETSMYAIQCLHFQDYILLERFDCGSFQHREQHGKGTEEKTERKALVYY